MTKAPVLLALVFAVLPAFVGGATVADAQESATAEPVVIAPAAKAKKSKNRLKVRKIRPRSGRTFVPLEATIRIRFSRPLDPESVNGDTIQLRRLLGSDVPHEVSLEKNNKLLVLTPKTFLDPGKDYEVHVRFGLISGKGHRLRREGRSIFFTDATVPPFQFLRPEQFTDVESQMFEGRAVHSATLMDDGSVLITGGLVDSVRVTDTAEQFDSTDMAFRPVASSRLQTPRAYHPTVRLSGGALVVGGWTGLGATSATEVFDPLIRDFRLGPEMLEERDFHAAVTLEDGRVLVVGGLSYVGSGAEYSRTAEIYDPSLAGFRETRSAPLSRRAGHRATLLDDGRVLITGGLPPGVASSPTAEIFDPVTERFTLTATPSLGHRQLHEATKLSTGAVLLSDGGNPKMELYDPDTDRFFAAGGASFVRRTRATASLLPGDRVLILGGFDQRGESMLILESMDLYLPYLGGGLGRVVRPDVVLPEPRAGHSATNLGDGRVLYVGGFGFATDDSLATAFIFSPE